MAEPPERPAGADVERHALAGAGLAEVAPLLAELSDDQRAVLLLRVLGDLSLDETAAAMGKRVGAVKALQHRAVRRLARLLERMGVTP